MNRLLTGADDMQAKKTVVLHVGRDNVAQKIYSRIGFVGLCGEEDSIVDKDGVLEIGFNSGGKGFW